MPSPFTSELGTNYCPRDEEVLEIHALLVEPLSRLQHIENRIADLQKAIDELTEELSSISAYVDAHKALISPVRRLPLDILQEIFVACLPTHRNCVMSASEPLFFWGAYAAHGEPYPSRLPASGLACILRSPNLLGKLLRAACASRT